ncbi:MAG: glycosyltransferase [Phycisphaerales bacterium]|nr:glycosyltransferase [Phycisphaerales bacterium]
MSNPTHDEPQPVRGQKAFRFDRHKQQIQRQGRARIVLAHDWLVGRRGGEAVLERIAAYVRQYHTAVALLTLFDRGVSIGEHTDQVRRIAAGKSRLPLAGPARKWMLPLFPGMVSDLSGWAASLHEEEPIHLLISTSSGLIKNIRAPESVPHLCYCHSPARWLWEQGEEYRRGQGGQVRGLGLALFGERLRQFDRSGTRGVNVFIANSNHTRGLIERVYSRDAAVIPPPVRTEFFTPDATVVREDFWLVVSALEPYKRVELAIEAAAKARQRLIIAGEGSMQGWLRAHARQMVKRHAGGVKGLVEFVGRVGDEQLLSLYRRARVLIFPQIEDFGITAVEAQACGCPVVARNQGGSLDTVISGKTGVFFDRPEPEAIIDAVRVLPNHPKHCRINAEKFSEKLFDQRMGMQIEQLL